MLADVCMESINKKASAERKHRADDGVQQGELEGTAVQFSSVHFKGFSEKRKKK